MLTHQPAGERCHLTFQLLEAELCNELSLYLSPNSYCDWKRCGKTWRTLPVNDLSIFDEAVSGGVPDVIESQHVAC